MLRQVCVIVGWTGLCGTVAAQDIDLVLLPGSDFRYSTLVNGRPGEARVLPLEGTCRGRMVEAEEGEVIRILMELDLETTGEERHVIAGQGEWFLRLYPGRDILFCVQGVDARVRIDGGPWVLMNSREPDLVEFTWPLLIGHLAGYPRGLSLRMSPAPATQAQLFVRGDVNGDGRQELTDAVLLLKALLTAAGQLQCADAADNGQVEVLDALLILMALFRGGDPVSGPWRYCRLDPTADALDCQRQPDCRPQAAAR